MKKHHGISLIETLVLISILALAAGASCTFLTSLTHHHARITTDTLETAIQTAQALAFEGEKILLCPRETWSKGVFILKNGNVCAEFTFSSPEKIMVRYHSHRVHPCLRFSNKSQKSADNSTFGIYQKSDLLTPQYQLILSKEGRIKRKTGL